MLKTGTFIILTALLLALIILFIRKERDTKPADPQKLNRVTINGNNVTVELADTPAKRAKGLMFRQSLEKDSGMLFIFSNMGKHSFWMANTKIALDIIWINENLKIVHLEENVQPCTTIESLCKTYSPSQNALYVLEVNAGWVSQKEVKVGDEVIFDIENLNLNSRPRLDSVEDG